MSKVATELSHTSSLIGTALRLLTDDEENQVALKTALGTLTRVLDAVDWNKISKGNADAWLYFSEDFLAVYDNDLRKLTGSYYTPPEVVSGMVGLVDEALRTKLGLHEGLAAASVTLADPATGTGTFFLGVLKTIVETVRQDQGEGAISGAVTSALKRLIAFEMQLGPFAVAQLRILAEVVSLTGKQPKTTPRMFVTNTLSDREEEAGWIPQMLAPLANQRKDANHVMRKEAITVVLGNPPYKEKQRAKEAGLRVGLELESPCALACLDAAFRVGRRRSCEASTKPVHLLLAVGDLEGLRSRERYARTAQWHCVLHHGRRLSERAGISEDARTYEIPATTCG